MIDLVQFRVRIGLFRQSLKYYKSRSRYCRNKQSSVPCNGKTTILLKLSLLIVLVNVLCTLIYLSEFSISTNMPILQNVSYQYIPSKKFNLEQAQKSLGAVSVMTGNFWAKYVNGNRVQSPKGIKTLHLNIRSLKNKCNEVKQVIKQENPTICGLSECELLKQNIRVENLSIPGYDLLLPKSWDVHGFARVVMYVKKSFKYEQILDLEHDVIQSVWIKGSFNNSKKIYFCHGYREHSSLMGNSISSQKQYLDVFLQQWEDAVFHGSVSQPNEVHVCADMNLDYSEETWLRPQYRLCSLTKMVQNICNANN